MKTRRIGKIALTLATVLLLAFTAACVPAVTGEEKEAVTPTLTTQQGTIEIRVTDPPPADVKSAVVHFNSVEVHRVSGNESGWITVIEVPGSFDLMDVIGVSQVLGTANVSAGSFTQIRMNVVEVSGETTDNVSYTAEVPSGELKIVRPFNVGAGKVTVLTLDFDGEKSLVRTGKSGKFLFKPVVKLAIDYEAKTEQEQEQEQEQGAEELDFVGTIDAINGNIWTMTIEGESRTVDVSEAEIEGEPAVGLQAEVEGTMVDDIIMASKVEIKEAEEG